MTTRLIIVAGQSNTLGMDGGDCASPGLPISGTTFFRIMGNENANRDLTDSVITTVRISATALPSMGLECQMCLDMMAGAWANDNICIVKCSWSSTLITQWLPTAVSPRYFDKIRIGCLAMRPQIGRSGFSAYFVWNQGEAECSSEALAGAWASNKTIIDTALDSFLGKRSRKIIIRVRDIMPGVATATVRSQQASVADDLINRDDTAVDTLGTYGGVPNVHDLCSAQNTIGSRTATAAMAAG